MAFNFNWNWSPAIADTSRARDMLTTALNKSPKPPIIVDDIIVTELNLGSVPPELEILEIGDLAEDRFRGIFKMSYTGDVFLTLKTRVQANPLNTYLSTKPSFASPQPLAASSSLTIPLQITLSEIKLSGFVILVFSRQKGITLVFRNDPLESLKVSSTFDSIPFVRDYLQKEIEGQLRVLFMEDLPAIIHRLSLRLWSPEHASREEEEEEAKEASKSNEQPIDPLASPPLDACDAFGRPVDEAELSSLSLDNSAETHATFSQKNLLRLAALTDSHRTLSLYTPIIRDAVFRAWAGAAERGDLSGTTTPTFSLASLSRHHSVPTSMSSVYSYSDSAVQNQPIRRPSIGTFHSTYSGTTAGSVSSFGTRPRGGQRQRKNRIVDLRCRKPEESSSTSPTETTTDTTLSISSRPSNPSGSVAAPSSFSDLGIYNGHSEVRERSGEISTPPCTPKFRQNARGPNARITSQSPEVQIHSPTPRPVAGGKFQNVLLEDMNKSLDHDDGAQSIIAEASRSSDFPSPTRVRRPSGPRPLGTTNERTIPLRLFASACPSEKGKQKEKERQKTLDKERGEKQAMSAVAGMPSGTPGGILEQAWMMKMANEIARKVREEEAANASVAGVSRRASGGMWHGRLGGQACQDEHGEESSPPPPPAYAA